MDVVREPRHLAHIRVKGPGHISAAAASPDGQLVAHAGAAAGSLRLYRLSAVEVRTVLPGLSRTSACVAHIKALGPQHGSQLARWSAGSIHRCCCGQPKPLRALRVIPRRVDPSRASR